MISKSDYLTWRDCPALLWHGKHDPSKLPSGDDPSAEARLEEGKQVEKLARSLFPEGTVIDHEDPFDEVAEASLSALASPRSGIPFCQALAQAGDLVCETDILVPGDDGTWDLYEVKASNEVKQEHVPDVAFQRHVLTEAGINVRKAHVVHLNREYVLDGEIVPDDLFKVEEVTEETAALMPEVALDIEEIRRMLAADEAPEIDLSQDAIDPRDYPLLFPAVAAAKHSVFDLYRGKRKAVELYNQGIVSTTDITSDCDLTDRQQIQVGCERSDEPHLDATEVGRFLKRLKAPLRFLDFETFSTAIPLIDGTSPYRQTPFQFSLHVCRDLESEPEHHGWIWDPGTEGDPRVELLRRLEGCLVGASSIIVYNAAFERMILRQAANAFPAFAGFVDGVLGRIVDLLIPFRNFWAYHPSQHGSCSIKKTLPAWCPGRGYDGMAIADGEAAAREFARVEFGGGAEERDAVRQALDRYCRLDTKAMLELLRAIVMACS